MTGFESKRQMAKNKLDDDDDTQVYADTLLIVYQQGFANGKKAAQQEQQPTCPVCKAGVLYECVACSSNNYPPKPQPPPEWEAIKNIIAEYGLQAIDFVSEWKAAQRSWVGLTPEEVKHLYPYGRSVWGKETYESIEKALKEKNGY